MGPGAGAMGPGGGAMGPGAGPPGMDPAAMGPGGMPWGGQLEEEKEPEESLSRSRLKYCLTSALTGLTGDAEGQPSGAAEPKLQGVGSLAGEEPHKSFVDSLRQRFKMMSDVVSYIKLTPTNTELNAREIRELEEREKEKLEAKIRFDEITQNLAKLEDELAKKPE